MIRLTELGSANFTDASEDFTETLYNDLSSLNIT
jgi:hypothetical protein